MTAPATSIFSVQSTILGDESDPTSELLNFLSLSADAGNVAQKVSLKIAAAATDSSVNLGTYVTTCTYYAIKVKDNGGTVGLKVGNASGAGKDWIAAQGIKILKNGNSTPPTLYFDNTDASNAAYVDIIILGAQS